MVGNKLTDLEYQHFCKVRNQQKRMPRVKHLIKEKIVPGAHFVAGVDPEHLADRFIITGYVEALSVLQLVREGDDESHTWNVTYPRCREWIIDLDWEFNYTHYSIEEYTAHLRAQQRLS